MNHRMVDGAEGDQPVLVGKLGATVGDGVEMMHDEGASAGANPVKLAVVVTREHAPT